MAKRRPLVLVVMDGWGVSQVWGGNATVVARTPVISSLWQRAPQAVLGAAEQAVGLPKGERGNSEVGHLNIGCGQVVHQDLPSISATIEDGSFYSNPVLHRAMAKAREGHQLHLIGLVSNGGIHSHIAHLLALLEMAKREDVNQVVVHVITDGRDARPMEALRFIEMVENKLKEIPNGCIGSVAGRYYAMDRENKWDRVEREYKVITEGVGRDVGSARAAVSEAYREGQSDEFIMPSVVRSADQMVHYIKDGDVVIFFNFRGDRARELTHALVQPNFDNFHRSVVRQNLTFVTFTSYQEGLPVEVAFQPKEVHNPLAKVVADAGWQQFHVAETAKYPHVTYFINGGKEAPFTREDRLLVPSPRVATYDQKPEMSAYGITKAVLKRLSKYDLQIVNFANADMVGHTGIMRAAVKAVETVDSCVGMILKEVRRIGANMIITADHGNIEQMINPETGEPDTEHTTNPVPFFFISGEGTVRIRKTGILADISPTILDYVGLPIPTEMTGKSLLEKSGG